MARRAQHRPLIGKQDGGRAQDRVGHALEGGNDDHGTQAVGALLGHGSHGRGDVLWMTQDGAAELVDDHAIHAGHSSPARPGYS